MMTIPSSDPSGRRALIALIAAAAIVGVFLAQGLGSWLISLSYSLTRGVVSFQSPPALVLLGGQGLTQWLPFGAGVFVVFWLWSPARPGLSVGGAVVRSLVAAAGGAVALSLVWTISISATTPFMSDLIRTGALRDLVRTLVESFDTGVNAFVDRAPLVVLAGVLVLLWSRHDRAPRPAVEV